MRTRPWLKWLLIGGGAVVVLAIAGPFIYFNFIQDDAPDEFSLDDVQTDATSARPRPARPTRRSPAAKTVSTARGRSPPAARPDTARPRCCSVRPAKPRAGPRT